MFNYDVILVCFFYATSVFTSRLDGISQLTCWWYIVYTIEESDFHFRLQMLFIFTIDVKVSYDLALKRRILNGGNIVHIVLRVFLNWMNICNLICLTSFSF